MRQIWWDNSQLKNIKGMDKRRNRRQIFLKDVCEMSWRQGNCTEGNSQGEISTKESKVLITFLLLLSSVFLEKQKALWARSPKFDGRTQADLGSLWALTTTCSSLEPTCSWRECGRQERKDTRCKWAPPEESLLLSGLHDTDVNSELFCMLVP